MQTKLSGRHKVLGQFGYPTRPILPFLETCRGLKVRRRAMFARGTEPRCPNTHPAINPAQDTGHYHIRWIARTFVRLYIQGLQRMDGVTKLRIVSVQASRYPSAVQTPCTNRSTSVMVRILGRRATTSKRGVSCAHIVMIKCRWNGIKSIRRGSFVDQSNTSRALSLVLNAEHKVLFFDTQL
jgi:hypothetical protein